MQVWCTQARGWTRAGSCLEACFCSVSYNCTHSSTQTRQWRTLAGNSSSKWPSCYHLGALPCRAVGTSHTLLAELAMGESRVPPPTFCSLFTQATVPPVCVHLQAGGRGMVQPQKSHRSQQNQSPLLLCKPKCMSDP